MIQFLKYIMFILYNIILKLKIFDSVNIVFHDLRLRFFVSRKKI